VNRTSLSTGLIVPALVAVLPGCGDSFHCPGSFDQCSAGVCVDIMSDENHCGACGQSCDTDEHCDAGACVPDLVCTAPEVNCGNECVDTETSVDHCGACDDPCPSTFDDCVGGECAAPILAMLMRFDPGKGVPIERDAYVLRDLTYGLTKVDDIAFDTPRVLDVKILPDGRLLLLAAQTEEVFELFVVSPRGGAMTRVSGPMPADGDVERGFVVSRDGTEVLYRADADTDDVIELYAASLAAPGTAVKVNGALVANGRVSRQIALSADGRRAAYIADADIDDLDELYTVDLTAATPGAPVKLNPETVTDSVWDFQMTPDGSRVVYRARVDQNGDLELRVASVASPGAYDLVGHEMLATSHHVDGYQLSSDGTRLAFSGGEQFLEESLWYVDLTQSPPFDATRLVDGRDDQGENGEYAWVENDLQLTPDGTHVLFRQVEGAFSQDRLFMVAVASPGAKVPLSAAGLTTDELVADFALSPDGTKAVYRGGADGAEGGNPRPGTEDPGFFESFAPALYAVDLSAATPTPELSSLPPVIGHDGIADGYLFLRDSRRVVYRADAVVAGQLDAYLVTPGTTDMPRPVSPPPSIPVDTTDVHALRRF
jgi:Tol biopolymer transport system component